MNNRKEIIIPIFSFIRFLSILLVSSVFNTTLGQTTSSKPVFDFKGRYIVAVSDADMVASAYLNGHLGDREGKDALSLIRLDKPVNELKTVDVEVSNSVTGPPSSVAVSPNGRYAIVIETRGQRPSGKDDPLLSDLPVGKMITLVDLADPNHPTIIQQLNGAEHPLSVAFNIDGSLVAITYAPKNTSQRALAIYQFAKGKLTNLSLPHIPDIMKETY